MLFNKKHVYLRSPLRISFVGGGTDLESYYSRGKPGHVVSATIDLYVYSSIKDMFDSNVRVHHAEIETEPIASRIQHVYSRIALEHFGMFKGAEVVITSDVMTSGSGLGASSALMSALIKGCADIRGESIMEKSKLAELTYRLECDAGTVGGRQDQYAVAFGGLNSITFDSKKTRVKPLSIPDSRLKAFESRLLLVFTNLARDSRHIQMNLNESTGSEKKKVFFDDLQHLSHEFLNVLQDKNAKLDELGKLLHEGWLLKKSSNRQATNPYIEQLYEILKKKGILGGKIMGAGGGGFFLGFVKDPDIKEKIKYELYPNFIALDVKFSFMGTEVLWRNF